MLSGYRTWNFLSVIGMARWSYRQAWWERSRVPGSRQIALFHGRDSKACSPCQTLWTGWDNQRWIVPNMVHAFDLSWNFETYSETSNINSHQIKAYFSSNQTLTAMMRDNDQLYIIQGMNVSQLLCNGASLAVSSSFALKINHLPLSFTSSVCFLEQYLIMSFKPYKRAVSSFSKTRNSTILNCIVQLI